ncbi:DUF6279 family lipoprotein [Piscinibacter terrae]|nr:DUF6279 family lipoprotein [Albitalea terrae]
MKKSLVRIAIIGALTLVLAACTAVRFGYNQGPQLAFWWLDRYIDFDDAQEVKAREAIGEWFRWHRATQLPDYAALLAKAQAEVAEPLTGAQICQWTEAIQQRMDTAFEHALPALADSVRALTPQQLEHLKHKYEKNLKEYRSDFLQDDADDRRKAQIKRVAERVDMVYGRVTDAQKARIAQLTDESPLDPQGWYVERKKRQDEALDAMRRLSAQQASLDDAKGVVRGLYKDMLQSPRPAYRAYQQRLIQYNCEFAAQVHNLATPEQRAHAVKRFKGWEEDARVLASQR